MSNPSDSNFNAFKTDIQLLLHQVKDEIRKEVKEASNGVLTEMRERMQRNTDERDVFYATVDSKLQHLEKIASETRSDGRETKELAKKTNGRVDRHDDILLGEAGTGEDGVMARAAKNSRFIAWLLAAGGAWLAFVGMLWMVWGGEIQTRGILNRPASDYVDYVDIRIKQWLGPNFDKPTVPPPNLTPRKNGVETPN